MEIIKDNEGKWIRPSYGNYLTQVSAVEDKDKLVVKQVYVHLSESVDQWEEITQEEADRIMKAKKASQGEISYPEVEVNQMISLFASQINNMEISDTDAIKYKALYPEWSEFIGKSLKKDFKISHNDKLYKTLQEVPTVLDQDGYRPGDKAAEALYMEINETNAGTKEDPIPYSGGMILYMGKFYIQNGIIYECTRDSGIPLTHDLSTLVDQYVKVAE